MSYWYWYMCNFQGFCFRLSGAQSTVSGVVFNSLSSISTRIWEWYWGLSFIYV